MCVLSKLFAPNLNYTKCLSSHIKKKDTSPGGLLYWCWWMRENGCGQIFHRYPSKHHIGHIYFESHTTDCITVCFNKCYALILSRFTFYRLKQAIQGLNMKSGGAKNSTTLIGANNVKTSLSYFIDKERNSPWITCMLIVKFKVSTFLDCSNITHNAIWQPVKSGARSIF